MWFDILGAKKHLGANRDGILVEVRVLGCFFLNRLHQDHYDFKQICLIRHH